MLGSHNCFRVIAHIVAAELASQRGTDRREVLTATHPHESLTDGRLAVDSIEILSLARAVNEFFELDRDGLDEWLLRRRSLAQWRDLALQVLPESDRSIGIRSGGSTGEPQISRHSRAHLEAETEELAGIVGGVTRVLCITPLNHIYGFLWGALLSERLAAPLVDGEAAESAASKPEAGDLIIGFPEWWRWFGARSSRFSEGVTGVTSTAPCPPELIHELRDQGLDRMIEVYGSSETGGIGWREEPDSPYRLLGHWRSQGGDTLVSTRGLEVKPPDRIRWHDQQHLEPVGRRDGALQIGGMNVWPQRVRETIETHPDIAECAIRPFETSGGTRLKAFIVPQHPDAVPDQDSLRQWLRQQLTTPERPVRIDFGDQLPRNAMGKLSDW